MTRDVGINSSDAVGWSYGDAVGVQGSIESLIYALFNSKSTIINIVSTRIYVSTLPDNVVKPSIYYERAASTPDNVLSGGVRFQKALIQIDSLSTSYMASLQLSTVVHRIMNGSTTFHSIQLTNHDASEFQPDSKRVYRISQDYSCRYKT